MPRRFDPNELELMDRPQPVSAELARDLQNLRALNRAFGSYALISHFLQCWIKPGASVRVADLATGSGDIPRLVVEHARKVGATIEIDAIDQQEATLEIARGLSSDYPEIEFQQGNALEWGENRSYDLVLCTLVLHHFSEADAICLLRRARELSRRNVLVSDLRRGFLASVGVHLLTTLIFREPMTVYDARLSAARAFSFSEMREMAEAAGWTDYGHARFRYARQAIWLPGES